MKTTMQNTSEETNLAEEFLDSLKDPGIRYIMQHDLGIPIDDLIPLESLIEKQEKIE